MKIIILGAGQVGGSTAERLVNEGNDVTVVDTNSYLLEHIQDRLDIRAVNGHASSPETLIAAGIEDADMLIAVTQNDEVNMVACQVANALFKTPKKLARIRASDYVNYPTLYSPDAFATDVIISPEQLVTAYIQRLIKQPEVLQVVEFFDGMAQLVAVEVSDQSPMAGKPISKLLDILPDIKMRVAAIFRKNQAIQASGREALQPGDEIFFLALTQHISKLVKVFRHTYKTYERILIAGGGNIGRQLARRIESSHKVKIIEMDPERARYIAEGLKKSVVLHGDAGDANLLEAQDIAETDVFCAVTNDDEVNILSSMLAKRLGARKVISIIGKASHVELVRGTSIDLAISPAQITIGSLLTHIRKGDVVTVHSLRQGAAEAIEVIAHGDLTTSKVVGRHIEQLKLPASASIAAILRNQQVLFSDKSLVIEPDDHLIIFISNQRDIMAVEKLFQIDFNHLQ